jgi:tetratricopeptide (TPR) repeat protein
VAACLPFGNALRCGFVFDDPGLIVENPDVSPEASWWTPLVSSYWPAPHRTGLYRPVTGLTYRIERGLFGEQPLPFHAANLLLHAAVSLLAYAVLRRVLRGRRRLALSIALVFAVHPLHTEAVTGVVGRAELLAGLFGLAGYLTWLWAERLPSALATLLGGLLFALAMASKESAVGWILLLAIHRTGLFADGRSYGDIAGEGGPALRRAFLRDAAILAGLACYLAARVEVLGTLIGLHDVTSIDNPIYSVSAGVRLLTAVKVLAKGIALTLAPLGLCADYSYNSIPLERQWFSPWGLLAAMLLALLVALFVAILAAITRGTAPRGEQRPRLLWALMLYAALILPVSNLLLPIGTIMAERLLYLPSLGVIAAVLLILAGLLSRIRLARLAPYLLALLLLFLGARTWQRNAAWAGDLPLFRATVAVVPENAKARVNLAATLVREGLRDEAQQHYQRALEIAPEYPAALNGLGHVRILQGRFAEAEELLQRAVALYPGSPEGWTRLGNLLLEVDRAAEALEAFERTIALRPRKSEGWVGKASALFLLERFGESADAWTRAQEVAGSRQDLRRHVAAAARKAGRAREAESILTDLVMENPQDAGAAHELAALLLEQGDRSERGLRLAQSAVSHDPTRRHLETLVHHLLARGRCDEARAVVTSEAMSAIAEPAQQALRRLVDEGCRE